MSSTPPKSPPEYSPVFLHSRREALIIFCLWMTGFFWAVPFCYYNGYLGNIENFDPDQVHTTLGVPTWLFWGIGIPWIVADVFTTWFCFFYMKDDDLDELSHTQEMTEKSGGVPPTNPAHGKEGDV